MPSGKGIFRPHTFFQAKKKVAGFSAVRVKRGKRVCECRLDVVESIRNNPTARSLARLFCEQSKGRDGTEARLGIQAQISNAIGGDTPRYCEIEMASKRGLDGK